MRAKRMLRLGISELTNIARLRAARQMQAPVAPEVRSPAGKLERLLSRAKAEADLILAQGHTPRLEYCISLMHMAYTYIDVVHIQDRPALVGQIAQALERCHAVGNNDPKVPVESNTPLTFICSYPRSGNTVSIQLAAQVLQAQIFEGMPNSTIPFSKRIYPKSYPYVRLIKDHIARSIYKNDRVALVIRDGRDCMVSLAFMTQKGGNHNFSKRGDLAAFIRWLETDYPFGGWARYMRDASSLNTDGDKHVMRYEDFMAGPKSFIDLVRFLDPSYQLTEEHLARCYENRNHIFNGVRDNPNANRSWGIGVEFEPDSLFYEWSQNRKGSSWRQSWDKEAKKALHETGATDFLIEYGYETDPNWWKE